MELNDIMQVHIWELPLKNNDINKSSEYMMVHDGALKKIKVENLYEYFNQDYKVKNTIEYFENLLSDFNKEYEPKYMSLGDSLNHYENRIDILKNKFNSNRDTIREMEYEMHISGINYVNFKSTLDESGVYHGTLSESFDSISNDLSNIKDSNKTNREQISEGITVTDAMIASNNKILSDYLDFESNIDLDKNKVVDSVMEKVKLLEDRINEEYDKLLAIFDHYHHISDV